MNRKTVAAFVSGLALALFTTSAHAEIAQGPAAEPRTVRDEPTEAPAQADEDSEAFRIGVLGGIGFPRPLALEGMIKVGGVLGLGVEYSLMPKTTISGVDTTFHAIAADARVFPFKGGFFIGVRGGRQMLSGSATVNMGSLGTYTESGEADTWFVNPRIGFLWTWRSGFTVGLDAGVQIPIGPSLQTTLPSGLPAQVNSTIASVANTFGNATTPTVDLLRIGFLF